ncbi:nucleotide sugar dehydrogenase [Prosthecobacter sp.]|jgi:UDP-N-acetyl-D-glucosamine dehydrogenase|uniref:nucleotide sugar dehydrogenase n=1 Tax=Prosthecobacter sp. TaxID=1965333 RepID=UPI003784036D
MSSSTIGIIGLGYVGLPLSLQFARTGSVVLGFDIDALKTDALMAGQSYILHISSAAVQAQRNAGRFAATTDFSRVRECEAIIICVPTPLARHRDPDLTYVLNTGRAIAPHLQRGQLVVLESTTYPGTTDTELREVLEAGSGLKAGEDFHLAFSPEREDPGNPQSDVAVIPKIVGGLTPACREHALAVYGRAIKTLVPVESCRVAEAVKLTENIFRAVNIAMVNELKVVYAAMGIDIWDVIDAAKTKPFGFMPFYPGPGLGGHCIPIDPFYLTWKARQYGQETRFIELAGEVNTAMPAYVIQRCGEALASVQRTIKGSRVLMIGIAYKSNVDDDRESPAYVLWEMLEHEGAQVDYHDPHVPVIRPSREHAHFAGRKSVPLSTAEIQGYDLVLIATNHKAVDAELIAANARLVVDSRNVLGTRMKGQSHYFKA